MDEINDYYVPQKSGFVTAIGVIFLVLAGVAILGIFANTIFMSVLQRNPEMAGRMQEQMDNNPMSQYTGILMAVAFILALVQIAASIGLLKRLNWARTLFIAIMVFGIIRMIFGAVMNLFISPTVPNTQNGSPETMQGFMLGIKIGGLVFTAVVCALYIWIIMKLNSKKIKMEFQPEPPQQDYDSESLSAE